jgi:hypothetical protein
VVKRLIERQWPLGEPRGERFALEVLHDKEVQPAVLPDVVEGADMRGWSRLATARASRSNR